MAYAQGKYARAICDRCGFDIPYLDLRKEWTGFKFVANVMSLNPLN